MKDNSTLVRLEDMSIKQTNAVNTQITEIVYVWRTYNFFPEWR